MGGGVRSRFGGRGRGGLGRNGIGGLVEGGLVLVGVDLTGFGLRARQVPPSKVPTGHNLHNPGPVVTGQEREVLKTSHDVHSLWDTLMFGN